MQGWLEGTDRAAQNSMSAAPDSFTTAVEQALPARSVAVAEGVHAMVPGPLEVFVFPLAVPRVMVRTAPDWTMVEGAPVRGFVKLRPTYFWLPWGRRKS